MTQEFINRCAAEACVPADVVKDAMQEARQLVRGFSDEAYWDYYASVFCRFYHDGRDSKT
jgi:hypothetical protein